MDGDDSCSQVLAAPGLCPAEEVDVPWADWFSAFVLRPAAVQAVLLAAFLALSRNFRWAVRRFRPFRRFLKTWVGTPDHNAKRYRWLIVALVIEMVVSSMSVAIWFMTVYQRQTNMSERNVLFVASIVNLLNWVTGSLQSECSVPSLMRASSIVTTFTVVPMLSSYFRQDAGGHDWLSLQFLRSLNVIRAFQRMRNLSPVLQQKKMLFLGTVVVLRVVALVVVMAGVIFTAEVLGDPPVLRDAFVASQGGDSISAYQMIYWTVVTITTVGFGDFAPRTTLSRVLTVLFIVTGVGYIGFAQLMFQQALLSVVEGSGAYHGGHGQKHVVVILCSKKRAMSFKSLVAGFLREVLHSTSQSEWPNVVIFSRHPWDDDTGKATKRGQAATFAEFLVEEGFPIAMREHVTFIVGSSSSNEDLERAGVGSSEMTFLLSDVNSTSPSEDDEDSIYIAVTLTEFYPKVRLRLMLLRPQSKELAVQSGIEIVRCFSLRELKAGMLAQNVRCHGIVPVITSMLKSLDDVRDVSGRKGAEGRSVTSAVAEQEHSNASRVSSPRPLAAQARDPRRRRADPANDRATTHSQAEDESEPEWQKEYRSGLQRSIYGFELCKEYAGCSFAELVSRIFRDTGAVVIACFIDSKLVVCKQDSDIVQPGTIMFAVASGSKVLDPCRKSGPARDNWRESLFKAREANLSRLYKEGPHFAAVQLMGHYLKDPILMSETVASLDEDDAIKRQSSLANLQRVDTNAEHGSSEAADSDEWEDSPPSPLTPHSPRSPARGRLRGSFRSPPELGAPARQSAAHPRQGVQAVAPQRARDRRAGEVGGLWGVEGRPNLPSMRESSKASATDSEAPAPSERAEGTAEEADLREALQCSCFGGAAPQGPPGAPPEAVDVGPPAPGLGLAALGPGSPGPQWQSRQSDGPSAEAGRVASEGSEAIDASGECGDMLAARARGKRGKRGSVESVISSAGPADFHPPSRFRPSDLVIGEQLSRQNSLNSQPRQSMDSLPRPSQDAHARDPAHEAKQRVLEMRRAARDAGEPRELVVVIVCHGEAWQQVHAFVTALRAKYQPVHSPIIISTPVPPPPLLFEGHSSLDLAIIEGGCTKVQSLVEAGILEASAVVVMTGASEEWHVVENLYRDSRVVLCAQVLECWCGISGREVFTTYELQDSTSVRILPRLMRKRAVDVDQLLLPAYSGADEHLPPLMGEDQTKSFVALQAMPERDIAEYTERPPETDLPGDAEEFMREDHGTSALFHPRFAAGQIFTPELWGSMLGRIYYMPAIIELIEALALPHVRGQTAFPWQIRVPPSYVGREYSTLFLDLAMGYRPGATDLDPRRESGSSQAGSPGAGQEPPRRRTTLANGVRLASKPRPAVCVALYRKRDVDSGWDDGDAAAVAQGTGGYNYTALAPSPGTVLREQDWVLVLGSTGFGRHMHRRGLLRECPQALFPPPAEE